LIPARSAAEFFITAFTSTPSFTPKNSANCGSCASDSPSSPRVEFCMTVIILGRSMGGIVNGGMGGMLTLQLPSSDSTTLCVSTVADRLSSAPLRHTEIFTDFPGAVSRTIWINWSLPSTCRLLNSRMTSPCCKPALDAGVLGMTLVT
jgi:hypothetical protein